MRQDRLSNQHPLLTAPLGPETTGTFTAAHTSLAPSAVGSGLGDYFLTESLGREVWSGCCVSVLWCLVGMILALGWSRQEDQESVVILSYIASLGYKT